ncbi:MAG TPA: DHHA1 domain-containing protein [Polyangiales bacterium]|nr:DHHA1 domain-containing protein [Polyangiales bacterium]
MGKKPLIIYHGQCIDGFTAAWVFWCLHGDRAEYFAAQYGVAGGPVELPDVTGHDVVMVDFCTSREQLLELKAKARSLRVLDHHKTAEAACAGLDFCTFDMERSGARLAWDFCVAIADTWGWATPVPDRAAGIPDAEAPPWLVSYVEDRDLWRFKLPLSKAINAFVSAHPMTFEAWHVVADASRGQAARSGEVVLAYIDRYVDEMCKQARPLCFAGHDSIPVVNAPYINISELVGKLAESSLFAVGWFQRGDGLYQYSLRSRGDFDVSALAKRFGGGGHKNAAGFTSSVLVHE